MSDPTASEIFSGGTSSGGRIAPVRNEVLRLMKACLPVAIAYQNSRESITIPTPQGYYVARESLEGIKELPVVVVSASLDFDTSIPRVNFGSLTIGIHCLGERIEVREQDDDLWDMAQIAVLIMKRTQTGWKLPDGREVWRTCIPTSVRQLPAPWAQYAGVSAYFSIEQKTGDLWTPATP
jgi:hypothetical protein